MPGLVVKERLKVKVGFEEVWYHSDPYCGDVVCIEMN
jgi:hypothetical protein